jgi:hypothetical protein
MLQAEVRRSIVEGARNNIALTSALALESRECEEAIEVAVHKREPDCAVARSKADEETSPVHQQHLSRTGVEEQSPNNLAITPMSIQMDPNGTGNRNNGNPQHPHPHTESRGDSDGRSLRDVIPAGMENQVESIRNWDRLAGQGVELELNLGAGRHMGVEISSNSSGKVSVLLQSDRATDRYALWKQRADMAKALEDAGCDLRDVLVRGDKPCRT